MKVYALLTSMPRGKNTWYLLDKRLGEPPSRYGLNGYEKHPCLPGIEPW
jgi:hypothetical protein